MNTVPEERYVTVQEAAERLGLSRATIWRLVKAGQWTATPDPVDGRAKQIPLNDIGALLRRSAQYARRAAQKGRAYSAA